MRSAYTIPNLTFCARGALINSPLEAAGLAFGAGPLVGLRGALGDDGGVAGVVVVQVLEAGVGLVDERVE